MVDVLKLKLEPPIWWRIVWNLDDWHVEFIVEQFSVYSKTSAK
ncbi:hypothetical protein T12_9892 [Trichinella patagoniensis]|uniref:Uncharacterized protein n=1 Tax=Trichinella patagoniensis TaxID=990121 RepID=A0A0V0YRZ3_9BILA|nr:hypothetical protein T12_9892 [Trichinella patagoniensis]